MKIDDFLKCKKVRLLTDGYTNLNKGSEYNLVRLEVVISNNAGIEGRYPLDDFEPVFAESKTQDETNAIASIDDLHPEFEALDKPEFKVGDPVYLPNQAGGKILKIQDNKACHYPFFVDVVNSVNNSLYEIDRNGKTKYGNFTDVVIKATPENYELLSKLHPHIEFEQPAKELKGSDLCRAIKAKGKKFIICAVSNISEEDAINNYLNGDQEMDVIFEIDDELDHPFVAFWGNLYKFAVPLSEETGEPLTESVLDE